MPGDFWDAVFAFCSLRETCPTDPSSVEDQEQKCLPNRLTTFTSPAFHELQQYSQLLAAGMQAKVLLRRRLKAMVLLV